MSNGSIVEEGDHATLIQRRGAYFSLVKQQISNQREANVDMHVHESTSLNHLGAKLDQDVSVLDLTPIENVSGTKLPVCSYSAEDSDQNNIHKVISI